MTQSSPIRALPCRFRTVLAGAVRPFQPLAAWEVEMFGQRHSPCLLALCWVWQVGKPSRRLEERSHQSGYLFPAGCTPGGFLSLVTAPQGSSSLDQHSHLWPGELLPSALPSDLGSHLYFTYPLCVHPDGLCNKRPLKYLMDCAVWFLSGPWSPMEMVNQSRGEDSELAWVAELRH